MNEFFSISQFFAVFLTLGVYQIGLQLRKKWDCPICNPILIAVLLLIPLLLLIGFPVEDYQAGMDRLGWLLTPATICLAVPLYEQLRILKKDLPAVLIGVGCGTATSIGSIFLMGKLFGLDGAVLRSLLPKSITTAMGIAVSEQLGGIPALTTAAIIVTGILGSICGESLCKLFRLKSKIAQGVAFGSASHVIGTSRATELDPLTGAVSSLSLVVAGVLTAVILSCYSLLCLIRV